MFAPVKENTMSTRKEAIRTLVYQAADAAAESAIDAGKGIDFLLTNGWLPFDIERAIRKEIARYKERCMSKQETIPCVWVPCGCNVFDACGRCGGRTGHYETVNHVPVAKKEIP